jgi:lipoate-protein ligase A
VDGEKENDEREMEAHSFPIQHSAFNIQHSSASPLLLDPPAAGPWNMAVDEALLETAAADGRCMLRLYRWQEPTLSLGYFQAYADRWQHAASSRAAVVRRSSGGGAILHDRELTYSLAIPSRHPLAARRLDCYRAVHQALIEVLAQWGIEATMFASCSTAAPGREVRSCDSVASQPGAAVLHSDKPQQREPFLCFQRRSPGDVLVAGSKIAGSAQRRCRGAVLQHGSVLLARSAAAPELDGLEELSGQTIPPERLIEAWLARLAVVLAATWQSGRLSDDQRRRADVLCAEKYASAAWTENRGRGPIPGAR